MSLSRYIKSKFGAKTRSRQNPLVTAVQVAVTEILHNNPDRLSYTLINLGANPVYVAFDNQPSATRGILLVANGGTLTLTADEDGELVSYELHGVAVGGASAIYLVETEFE